MKNRIRLKLKPFLYALLLSTSTLTAYTLLTTTNAASTSTATQISPIQIAQVVYGIKTNMTQQNLTSAEKNLYQQLYALANSQQNIYDSTITSIPQQYENIRAKIRLQFSTVQQTGISNLWKPNATKNLAC